MKEEGGDNAGGVTSPTTIKGGWGSLYASLASLYLSSVVVVVPVDVNNHLVKHKRYI